MSAAAASGDLIQVRVKLSDQNKVLSSISKTGTTVRQLLDKAGVSADVAVSRVRVLRGFPPKAVDISSDQDPLNVVGIENGDSLKIEMYVKHWVH